VLVCAGKRSAAQPWRWHNANNMCTTRDINRATASGEVHTTKVCAHPTPGPRKAGPSLDGGVLSVWVPTASRNSACARRNKDTTPLQGKGARAATTAAAPAKRPARLEDRLSSDGGSARRRGAGQRSSHINSELTRLGPSSARRPGPQQGRGGFSPRVPGHGGEAAVTSSGRRPGLGLLQEKQSSTTPSPAGPAPTPRWRLDHGRPLPSPGGSGSRANGNGIKVAGTRLDIVGAHVVRRPPQQPPGEEDGLTGFRGSGGLVASRCAAKEQRLGATRFPA
jgi:hypothetical protein